MTNVLFATAVRRSLFFLIQSSVLIAITAAMFGVEFSSIYLRS